MYKKHVLWACFFISDSSEMVSNCCEFYIDNKMRVGYIFTIIIVYFGNNHATRKPYSGI